ncbi:hypothetical protein, partial [Klebsiella pneumoniae]|uniref:hypothetical protein n=1 Tax=Klebsiella pneumoniae TaxID=573 RepID=UPI0040556DA9
MNITTTDNVGKTFSGETTTSTACIVTWTPFLVAVKWGHLEPRLVYKAPVGKREILAGATVNWFPADTFFKMCNYWSWLAVR